MPCLTFKAARADPGKEIFIVNGDRVKHLVSSNQKSDLKMVKAQSLHVILKKPFQILFIVMQLFAIPYASGQTGFRVGSSEVSIEPDSSIFSVALAGYAAPREGRFTITWQEIAQPFSMKTLAGANGRLYAINNENQLVGGIVSDLEIKWQTIGGVENTKTIAGANSQLYGVNDKNELLRADLGKKAFSWRKVGDAENIIGLTISDEKLFGVGANNNLYVTEIGHRKHKWQKVGTVDSPLSLTSNKENLLSVTSNKGALYVLKSDNTIWRGMAKGSGFEWTKIGRNNEATYDIDVRQLTVLNNRLYALGSEGKLYRAEHSTKGDLTAGAMAIGDGNKTVVIVGVDLRGFDYSFITEVKEIIWKTRQIPPSAIFINASHTHFAPVAQELPAYGPFMQRPDPDYMEHILKKGIVEAIESALDDMETARIFFGRTTTDIGYNRSSRGKPYDKAVDVVKVEKTGDRNAGILFLTGCHPVFRNSGKEGFTMSANYPGVTRHLLKTKTKADNAVFIQGCAGDINPTDDDHEKTGLRLAFDVMSVLSTDMKEITGSISYALDTIQIPIVPWSVKQIQEFKTANSGTADIRSEKNVRWSDIMLKHYEENTMPSEWPVYVHTLNIGNWKLVGLSREAVTEYGLAIKKLWPDKNVSVAGYTNHSNSYLPRDWHITDKKYEGYESFLYHAQPAILPPNVMDIIINKVKSNNR